MANKGKEIIILMLPHPKVAPLQIFLSMLESVVKKREIEFLIFVALVVAPLLSLLALFFTNATFFSFVNQGLKLLIMFLMGWAAIRSISPSKLQLVGRSEYYSEWTVVLLIGTIILSVFSFLLDSQDQRRATEQAIDRHSQVINDLKRIVLPLNDAITAHFNFRLNAHKGGLKPLTDSLLPLGFRNGKLEFGVIPINAIDVQNPIYNPLANFLYGLPRSLRLCSTENCLSCELEIDLNNPHGVELVADVPLGFNLSDQVIATKNVHAILRITQSRYEIGLNSEKLRFRVITNRWTNSEDLAKAIVYFQAPPQKFEYELLMGTLMRSDGKVLRMKELTIIERCGTRFYSGHLAEKWM